MTADDLEAVPEDLGGQDFHGRVFQIGADIVGLDAGGIDLLEEVDAHAQIDVADAVDGEADGVLAGIEHAVLAGAVIFEFEQVIAVVKRVHVLGLAGVDEFLFHNAAAPFMFV